MALLSVDRRSWSGGGVVGEGEGNTASDGDAAPERVRAPRPAPTDGASGTTEQRVEAAAFSPARPPLPGAGAVASPPHTVGAPAAAAPRRGGDGGGDSAHHVQRRHRPVANRRGARRRRQRPPMAAWPRPPRAAAPAIAPPTRAAARLPARAWAARPPRPPIPPAPFTARRATVRPLVGNTANGGRKPRTRRRCRARRQPAPTAAAWATTAPRVCGGGNRAGDYRHSLADVAGGTFPHPPALPRSRLPPVAPRAVACPPRASLSATRDIAAGRPPNRGQMPSRWGRRVACSHG